MAKFPENFLWGVSTSSYQTEGACNADGKTLNVWDVHCRKVPSPIVDSSSGDDACNFYNRTEEIVAILKDLGVKFYRFSLSWTRIMPGYQVDVINRPGIDHYNRLIDRLLENHIQPMVTIYHWDHPQCLEDQGGWLNSEMPFWFQQYADICFQHFGPKVKYWLTVNEGREIARNWYDEHRDGGNIYWPGSTDRPGEYCYTVAHHIMLAHARAYRLYEDKYKQTQQGLVGACITANWFEPESESDRNTANVQVQFDLGWFCHPLFIDGDYPDIMKKRIAEQSKCQGYAQSRLPQFSDDDKQMLLGAADFIGFNYYTGYVVRSKTWEGVSYKSDCQSEWYHPEHWKGGYASPWLKLYPEGLSNVLQCIKTNYGNIPVIITENGCSDDGSTLDDEIRIDYVKRHLMEVVKAIERGCPIIGYSYWSLTDNFEWIKGYSERFGLYRVDFDTEDKTIQPKASATFFKDLIKKNSF